MNRRRRRVAGLVAGLLCALAAEACSGSSGGSGGGPAGDAAAADGSHPRDGAAADHTTVEAASPEASVEASTDAGDDGGPTCPPPTAKGTACASCVQSNCEDAWCTCRSDLDDIDEAGDSGCVRYVECAEQCVASDAGSPTECLQKICGGFPLSPIEEKEGQTLIDCLVAYCASDCVE